MPTIRTLLIGIVSLAALVAVPSAFAIAQWTAPVPKTKTVAYVKHDLKNNSLAQKLVLKCAKKSGLHYRCTADYHVMGPSDEYETASPQVIVVRYTKNDDGMIVTRRLVKRPVKFCPLHSDACFTSMKSTRVDTWDAESETYVAEYS